MFSGPLPKILPFMRFEKIWQSRTGHRWKYNIAHAHRMLDT